MIISSATCDVEELKGYYSFRNKVSNKDEISGSKVKYDVKSPAILNIVGKCYPVEIFYASGKFSAKLFDTLLTYLLDWPIPLQNLSRIISRLAWRLY